MTKYAYTRGVGQHSNFAQVMQHIEWSVGTRTSWRLLKNNQGCDINMERYVDSEEEEHYDVQEKWHLNDLVSWTSNSWPFELVRLNSSVDKFVFWCISRDCEIESFCSRFIHKIVNVNRSVVGSFTNTCFNVKLAQRFRFDFVCSCVPRFMNRLSASNSWSRRSVRRNTWAKSTLLLIHQPQDQSA